MVLSNFLLSGRNMKQNLLSPRLHIAVIPQSNHNHVLQEIVRFTNKLRTPSRLPRHPQHLKLPSMSVLKLRNYNLTEPAVCCTIAIRGGGKMKSVEEQNSHFSPPSFHSNRATRELFSRRTRNCIVDIPPPSSLPFPTPPQYDLMTSFVAFFIFYAKLNYGRTGGQCTSCNANTATHLSDEEGVSGRPSLVIPHVRIS